MTEQDRGDLKFLLKRVWSGDLKEIEEHRLGKPYHAIELKISAYTYA